MSLLSWTPLKRRSPSTTKNTLPQHSPPWITLLKTALLRAAVIAVATSAAYIVTLGTAGNGPLGTEPAEAINVYYCGYLVAPYSRCPSSGGYNRFVGNRATYPGSGYVSVCERANGSIGTVSRRCAFTTVASGSDLPSGYVRIYVGNNDNNRHTVNSKGVY